MKLTVTASTVTPGQATVELKAVAQRCGNQIVEDTTIIEVPVIIAEVDECAEDIFPPELETDTAILRCFDKIFPTSQYALACFSAPGRPWRIGGPGGAPR